MHLYLFVPCVKLCHSGKINEADPSILSQLMWGVYGSVAFDDTVGGVIQCDNQDG